MKLWILVFASFVANSTGIFIPLNASSKDYNFQLTESSCNKLTVNQTLWSSAPLFSTNGAAITPLLAFYKMPANMSVIVRTIDGIATNLTSFFQPDKLYQTQLGARIFANYLIVEVVITGSLNICPQRGFGFGLSGFYSATQADLIAEAVSGDTHEGFCGTDNSENVVCTYNKLDPLHSKYSFSRPVARIVINPGAPEPTSCSGWLWGSDGYFITNNHCIGSALDASTTQFQFLAESYLCSGSHSAVCPGITEAISATFIHTNPLLDYTLVKLNPSLPQKYGYLQALSTAPTQQTPIYIPQHPRGGCKLISYLDDGGAPTRLTNMASSGCSNKGGIAYNADTDGGSSGSPVISTITNAVVALHYCGATGCLNSGIPMYKIIADLASLHLLPPAAVATGSVPLVPAYIDPTINPLSTGPAFTKQAVIDGVIEQTGISSWQTSVDHIQFHLEYPGQVIIDVLSYEMDDTTALFDDVNGDCRIAYFDSIIYVYSSDSQVSYAPYMNDDVDSVNPEDGKADGSISYHDSYLVVALPAGEHTIAIGAANLALADAKKSVNTFPYAQLMGCSGANTTLTASGAYRITLSATTPLTITQSSSSAKFTECIISESTLIADCESCLLWLHIAWLVAADSTNFVPLTAVDGIGLLGRECVEPSPKVHSWQSSIFFESDAVAMRFHFDTLFLPPGDSLVLRSVTNSTFNLSSIFLSKKQYTNVWTPRVFDSLWTLELQRSSTLSYCLYGYGASVDSYEYFTSTNNQQSSGYEQGCGLIDHTVHAICGYDKSNRINMYTYSRPVVRIWIPTGNSGFEMCTGWLWGNQGHLLTASHCVGSALDAKLAQFEFLAEATWCEANIDSLCSGIVSTVTATWIATNSILDYTLLLLSSGHELVQRYGYLQVHSFLELHLSQPIYIPQHPRGGCKLISYQNQLLQQTSITSLNAKGCDVNNDGFYRGGVVYDADTDAGSSGSPVIEMEFHTVVALHYCGGDSCQNAGIPMNLIVQDLISQNRLPPKALRMDSSCTIPLYPNPVVIPALLPPPYQYAPILGTLQRLGSSKQPYATTVDTYELVVQTPTQVTIDLLVYELDQQSGNCTDLIRDCRITYGQTMVYVYAKFKNETYQPYVNDGLVNPFPKMLGKGDGSISDLDPYLVATLPPGRHLVAFGVSRLSLYDAMRGINTNPATVLYQGPGQNFDLLASIAYRMSISSTQPIQLLNGYAIKTLPTCTITEAAVEATCQESSSSEIYD